MKSIAANGTILTIGGTALVQLIVRAEIDDATTFHVYHLIAMHQTLKDR